MWKFKHVAVLFVLFLCACTGATEEECTVTTHTPTCNGAIKYMMHEQTGQIIILDRDINVLQ